MKGSNESIYAIGDAATIEQVLTDLQQLMLQQAALSRQLGQDLRAASALACCHGITVRHSQEHVPWFMTPSEAAAFSLIRQD